MMTWKELILVLIGVGLLIFFIEWMTSQLALLIANRGIF